MLSWREVLAHHERYKDRLREAEKEQLFRQMLSGRERRHRWHHRVATWLGSRLVTWGHHLKERYGAAVTIGDSRARKPLSMPGCAVANPKELTNPSCDFW